MMDCGTHGPAHSKGRYKHQVQERSGSLTMVLVQKDGKFELFTTISWQKSGQGKTSHFVHNGN